MEKFRFTAKSITNLALLTALEIVLSRFLSFSVWNVKIGFSFVPIAVAAMLYGPLAAGITAALADFLGAVLFPIGPYFPGFTLTAALTGLVFGYFLKKENSVRSTACAVLIVQFLLGLLLNTFWIHLLYSSPFVPLLATRVVQSGIISAAQIIVIPILAQMMGRLGKLVQET